MSVEHLAREDPFTVHAEPEGGYVIVFPDLPGCMTQVERLEEVGPAAEEIRALWIETEYEAGANIPLPSYPEEYSGKFNLRLSRALHRTLAEAAARNSVSLNTYVSGLLERGHAQACVERRIEEYEARLLERLARIEGRLEVLVERQQDTALVAELAPAINRGDLLEQLSRRDNEASHLLVSLPCERTDQHTRANCSPSVRSRSSHWAFFPSLGTWGATQSRYGNHCNPPDSESDSVEGFSRL